MTIWNICFCSKRISLPKKREICFIRIITLNKRQGATKIQLTATELQNVKRTQTGNDHDMKGLHDIQVHSFIKGHHVRKGSWMASMTS
jgi:hypothetical protein